ncbi:MAG: glycyl-radical enzyme activating protein [Bacteroidota bacterium]|nr:glycyl-radical enzyme activating protein [Bacteroidota bacterium]
MSSIPLIFDLVRGSFVDGPGIRTTVFFKGCPLRCVWCHNPESQIHRTEIAWYADKCVKCNTCIRSCPENAISYNSESLHPSLFGEGPGVRLFNREKCTGCGKCVEACSFNALKQIGTVYSPEKLIEILLRDKAFYESSGGGITFSGGEPLVHIPYLEKVCRELKKQSINIAVQTSGFFNYKLFEQLLKPYIDIIYFDLKVMNRKKHYFYTGQYNDLILENLYKLQSEKRQTLIVRTPMVPEITATEENTEAIKLYLKRLHIDGYEMLAYNPSGINKCLALGRDIPERHKLNVETIFS